MNLRGCRTFEYLELEDQGPTEAHASYSHLPATGLEFQEKSLRVDQLLTFETPEDKEVRLKSEAILAGPKPSEKYSHFLRDKPSTSQQTQPLRPLRNYKEYPLRSRAAILERVKNCYPLPFRLRELCQKQKILDSVLTLFKKCNKPAFLTSVSKVIFESSDRRE